MDSFSITAVVLTGHKPYLELSALSLRSGPDVVYDILGALKQGDPLKVTGKNPAGDWLEIIAPSGQEGWVAATSLVINIPLADVAIAQPPPTPTPTYTPTPTPFRLPAPQLILPPDGYKFVTHEGAVIDLQWTWIRPLDEDEWFALGLRYWRDGEVVYTGEGKLKETKWRVPSYFFGQADQPERVYYWDIVVIKVTVNQDGSETITPMSLTSETRAFYWP